MQRFTYVRPSTPAEAIRAMADGGPGTRFLAGGTTLFDLMKLGAEAPRTLIDVSRLDMLARVDTSGSHELVFGALARMSDVAADLRLREDYPALSESLAKAASQQLRNMARVGPNLLQRTRCAYFRGGEVFPCNKRAPGSGCAAREGLDRGHAILGASDACSAVYPGDWAIALLAFDAVVDTLSPRGERSIPLRELHREPGSTPDIETVLAPDELLVRIRVPTSRAGRGSTYHKIRDRESYAFALTSAAVAVRLEGGVVTEARVALGGVATRPWRSPEAENVLLGQLLTEDVARRAGQAAFAAAKPGRQNAFKVELGARTVTDALLIARRRAEPS
ncbi:Periplasmic aromatic aldehyde oxidoreductase, FAD binding subunit YagS [Cystobacter fuscus DSM 2262]|uniref:Periplasmic aromatic aldehyde oxidoreductase, FAD binding subunit YagS n=1 Tax=Cystobacter fuscus (strain ATCC 25194 / DSM 2262 / NBRC 100088 / M29) TaxID=1242864 RepID=S9Q6P6_CYSF2|nr:xanthine dehydrogenase family protein subunit M [Cystobacter fuscus]EPX56999.1 Periplasmic aromatic aldehyde oxidoreductase, FAD binding subunit YagS [Cystobacter fuscus DSM 2262]